MYLLNLFIYLIYLFIYYIYIYISNICEILHFASLCAGLTVLKKP